MKFFTVTVFSFRSPLQNSLLTFTHRRIHSAHEYIYVLNVSKPLFTAIARVCELLGTESEWLKRCLFLRRITAGSTREEFMKKCSPSECDERRDCMAKLIYSR